jgi:hypothetical protein
MEVFSAPVRIEPRKIRATSKAIPVCEFVDATGIVLQPHNQVLITADFVFLILQPPDHRGVVIWRIQLGRENLNTPPPRFLPIER